MSDDGFGFARFIAGNVGATLYGAGMEPVGPYWFGGLISPRTFNKVNDAAFAVLNTTFFLTLIK